MLSSFFPIRAATFGYRRLVLAPVEQITEVRQALYFQAIALQWGLSALMLSVWWMRGRSPWPRALSRGTREWRS